MNVHCPQCQTVYRVDPEKVPVAGVRARCVRCQAMFPVRREEDPARVPATATTAPAARLTTPSAPEVVPRTAAPAPIPQPVTPAPPPRPAAETPSARPAPVPRPIPPMPAAQPATPAPNAPRQPSFLKQDPQTRAQRLARALVSDIVAYNRERRDQMLAAGTLKNEFREEIRKSWEEYVAQVGLELARNTPYFREALNDILAKGQHLF